MSGGEGKGNLQVIYRARPRQKSGPSLWSTTLLRVSFSSILYLKAGCSAQNRRFWSVLEATSVSLETPSHELFIRMTVVGMGKRGMSKSLGWCQILLGLRRLFSLEEDCQLVIAIRNLNEADRDSPLASVNVIMRQLRLSGCMDISDLSEVASTSDDLLELFDERVGLRKDLIDPCRSVDIDGDSAFC